MEIAILLAIGIYLWTKRTAVSFLPGDSSSGAAGVTVDETKVTALSLAITNAEHSQISGNWPNHNPGDIEDATGAKIVYASDADGMSALNGIVRGWLTGVSKLYSLDDSFYEVGRKYVNGPNAGVGLASLAWAANVVWWLNANAQCNLTGANTLRDFLNYQAAAAASVYAASPVTPSCPGGGCLCGGCC
jgi:hypothetical protein